METHCKDRTVILRPEFREEQLDTFDLRGTATNVTTRYNQGLQKIVFELPNTPSLEVEFISFKISSLFMYKKHTDPASQAAGLLLGRTLLE